MAHESKSETPASMYDWRVEALDAWLHTKSDGGSKPVTMEMLNEAGHLDQFHYKGIEANEEIMELLQVDASDKLLDVGCGIGGPRRVFFRALDSFPNWGGAFPNWGRGFTFLIAALYWMFRD